MYFTSLAKSVLIPSGLTAALELHIKILGSGTTTLIISNEEKEDIMKIAKSLEVSGLLIKRVSETIQNEAKEQKGVFLSVLLVTLSTSLLGNKKASKGIKRAEDGTIRDGYGSKGFLIKKSSKNKKIQFRHILN